MNEQELRKAVRNAASELEDAGYTVTKDAVIILLAQQCVDIRFDLGQEKIIAEEVNKY